jgi:hypothetical protein
VDRTLALGIALLESTLVTVAELVCIQLAFDTNESGKDPAIAGSACELRALASLPVDGTAIGSLSRLRRRPREAARVLRSGRSLEHAVADNCGRESEGQVGAERTLSVRNDRLPGSHYSKQFVRTYFSFA